MENKEKNCHVFVAIILGTCESSAITTQSLARNNDQTVIIHC
jgi:hypothetical protein